MKQPSKYMSVLHFLATNIQIELITMLLRFLSVTLASKRTLVLLPARADNSNNPTDTHYVSGL